MQKRHVLSAMFLLVWTGALVAEERSVQLREPWDSVYEGNDATGGHVIGLWQFEPDAETVDDSGHGHKAVLRGGTFSGEGRFGGGLESFRGHPVADKPHGVLVRNHADLSPRGGFTIEFWLKAKPELEDYAGSFLVDKKYVADTDYQILLGRADRNGSRVLTANLGFGDGSESYPSEPLTVEIGTWYHVAFTYDGLGRGTFFLNGKDWGSTLHPGRRSIAPGKHPLVIGDRIGSYYGGFPGYLDQVRICKGVREFRSAGLAQVTARTSFRRMEPEVTLTFSLTNQQSDPLADATVILSIDGTAEKRIALPNVESGRVHTLDYGLDTRLRPDEYHVHVRVELPSDNVPIAEQSFPVAIVGRRPPDRFPVLMWGLYRPQAVLREMDRLKRIGFTHVLGLGADYGRIREENAPTVAADAETVRTGRMLLNEALKRDLTIVASLSPGSYLEREEELLRIDRGGTPYERKNICGLSPGIRAYCYNAGASVARTYGAFPAFGGALIHTEVRDSAQVCFHEHDKAAYRERTGQDIPEQVTSKWGVKWGQLENFPADRVIADDHPVLGYLRWYYKAGDGWNGLNTAVHEGLQSGGRGNLWTFHDPAVRVASVYGSGGAVETISHWTYTYPDPIRIGLCTDELLAMAGGAAHEQNVMKMTQIIWYRSGTAPIAKPDEEPPGHRARWEREQPNAPFVTIAPMHLREALWSKIARPIRGIMYHGWQSLVPTDSASGYRFTHPQTQQELARLLKRVIRPLGPTLLYVPGAGSDVAMLESFASQMFAGRGTYGWGRGWLGDVHLVLQYAHLQPEILYDETILRRGLEDFGVLVLADCDVLTRSVAEKIQAFQAKGGIVIGDKRLARAIKPDIRLNVYKRTKNAAKDKAALLKIAAGLRKQLDSRYSRPVDTTEADVIPYLRRYKGTDYVFLVNDRREPGGYVGHHGLVMESGLPAEAVVTLKRKSGFVYDLVENHPVQAESRAGRLEIETRLGPCDGRLLAVTQRPIDRIRIQAPDRIARGATATCTIEVLDPSGDPLDAVIPVQVEILDAETRPAEFSGHYAAVTGTVTIQLDIAANEPKGIWQITAREGASGRRATHYLRVVEPGEE